MAVETYVLDGPRDFTFPHPVRFASQIAVEVTPGGIVAPSEYQVIGAGPSATAVTIRYPNAPSDGQSTLRISRFVEPERVVDFPEDGNISARALNAEFDNVYQTIQNLVAGTLPTDTIVSENTLPTPGVADYEPTGQATARVITIAPASSNSGPQSIIASMRGGGSFPREVLLVNVSSTKNLNIVHEETAVGAVPEYRFLTPSSATFVIPPNGGVPLFYDLTASRWRVLGV